MSSQQQQQKPRTQIQSKSHKAKHKISLHINPPSNGGAKAKNPGDHIRFENGLRDLSKEEEIVKVEREEDEEEIAFGSVFGVVFGFATMGLGFARRGFAAIVMLFSGGGAGNRLWSGFVFTVVARVVEDKFYKAFLCEGYLTEQEGRISTSLSQVTGLALVDPFVHRVEWNHEGKRI
nr:hypothetical protein CFP56_26935 [Quercus suber]